MHVLLISISKGQAHDTMFIIQQFQSVYQVPEVNDNASLHICVVRQLLFKTQNRYLMKFVNEDFLPVHARLHFSETFTVKECRTHHAQFL